MSQRQRMKISPPQPKVAWKTVAVTGDDAHVFARNLESALQELTDNGYHITSQVMRDGATIITGQRMENTLPSDEQDRRMDAPTQPPPAPRRRRVLEKTAAPPTPGTVDEVLYHYIEHGKQLQKSFPSMVDALRLVKEHLGRSSLRGEDTVTPICLIATSMTYFDVTAIPYLLKTFAEDLAAPKPLE